MWKAVSWLRGQGRLTGKAGQVPQVAPKDGELAVREAGWGDGAGDSLQSGISWQRLSARIRKDVLNGLYKPGSLLPSLKQLEHQYRTSKRSLNKALAALCNEGILQICGRGFSVSRPSAGHAGSRIALLALDEYLEHYYLGMPQGHDYVRDTELLASQAGIRLTVEPYRNEGTVLAVDAGSTVFPDTESDDILGYLYILSDPNNNDPLLKSMTRHRKPLSIIEQNGNWSMPAWLRDYPVKVFPVGVTTGDGERVGRFLRSLGHRRIAYFTPYHPLSWSEYRYQGLSSALGQAGLPDAAVKYATELSAWSTFLGPSKLPKVKLRWPEELKSFAFRNEVQWLEIFLRERVDQIAALRRVMQKSFEQALRDERTTAWVTVNDAVAAVALEFLNKKGVKVPGDISLVSFDDSYSAIANQITSYNFNVSAIMGEAFRHITGQGAATASRRAKVVRVDGMVVERKTSGAARAVS
jgi:hypothetical protein